MKYTLVEAYTTRSHLVLDKNYSLDFVSSLENKVSVRKVWVQVCIWVRESEICTL